MKKSTKNVLVFGGVGIGILYLISKANLSGAISDSISDITGNAITGGIKTVVETVVKTVQVPMEAAASGAVNSSASAALDLVPNTTAKSNTWDKIFMYGTPIGTALGGLTLAANERYRYNAHYLRGDTSGYKTATGWSFVDPSAYERAAQWQQISTSDPSLSNIEVAYLMALQRGTDVSNWQGTENFSPSFRQRVGLN